MTSPRLLLIVESPTKARTIQRLLSLPGMQVLSSQGHVRDLPEKDFGIDVDKGFQAKYVIIPGKKKIIDQLRKACKEADQILFATDEDREGEAIAWHLAQVLGIPEEDVQRAVFHEITEKALRHAVEHPRPLDMHLVQAQWARRLLDRIVGYQLSPLLWRKIPGWRARSAGRVQSVAVRLLVEREREIERYQPHSRWTARTWWKLSQKVIGPLPARWVAPELGDSAEQLFRKYIPYLAEKGALLTRLHRKETRRNPPPPFITSTLQQEAFRVLGFSATFTMRLAQELYENGYITYMRTDSVHLSEEAIARARDFILQQYGEAYSEPRQFRSRIRNAQEAHEAIRPTDFFRLEVPLSDPAKKLYQLIWRRAIASQMTSARYDVLQYWLETSVDDSGEILKFAGEIRVETFDGFLRVYRILEETEKGESDDSEESSRISLKDLEQVLHPGKTRFLLVRLEACQKWTPPPSRYTEASLIRELEKRGIGRPSTYAPILHTIIQRGYAEVRNLPGKQVPVRSVMWTSEDGWKEETRQERLGAEKRRLVPTPVAHVVTDFLLHQFPEIMDYEFTARMEDALDQIAEGKLSWQEFLRKFYEQFSHRLKTSEHVNSRELLARTLQSLPGGEQWIVRPARYGPVLEIRNSHQGSSSRYISIPPPYRVDNLTVEQAEQLMQLPRMIGTLDGKPIELHATRRGFYLTWQNQWFPLNGHPDPLFIQEEEARAWIQSFQEQRNRSGRRQRRKSSR